MMEPLELAFHPAARHPVKAAVVGFGLGLAFQVLWQVLDPFGAVVLSLLLLLSTRDFFLETRYRFDGEGVSVSGVLKTSRAYPWRRFRAFVEDRNGLFLSPYRSRRSLDQQRGVFLPMSREQRLQAARFCEALEMIRRAA
jgi:hypothetical protein